MNLFANNRPPSGALGFLLLFLIGAPFACRRAAPSAPEPPPPLVLAAAADSADVPIKLIEIGSCAPKEKVEIRAQVSGKILSIHFEDGDDVEAGALLFKIDPAPYAAELARANAQLLENQARLDDAKREYERVKDLGDKGAISKQDVDTKKNRIAVAQATIAASEADITNAKISLEWCEIRAPLSGRLGRRLVDAGNLVRPESQQTLVTIQRVDPIYVEFYIPESELPAVRAKQASGALAVFVSEPDTKNKAAAGSLTFWDSEIKRETGTVMLRATLPNETRRFWPGEFVHIELILEMQKNAVLVPARAVQTSAAGPFVYIIKSDGTAESRSVVPGPRQGEKTVIQSGVAAGERVITDGHILVMPGKAVREKQRES